MSEREHLLDEVQQMRRSLGPAAPLSTVTYAEFAALVLDALAALLAVPMSPPSEVAE